MLKINKIWQKDFIYTIFSRDYGKIRVNKKYSTKEKSLDLWYNINFEIETRKNNSIHRIRNIKIVSEFLNKKRNFSEINNYLLLLNSILKRIADWVPVIEISEIVEKINSYENLNEIKLILANLKIINIAWELGVEHKNITVWKILKFINNSKIDGLLKLNWINENIKKELEKLI